MRGAYRNSIFTENRPTEVGSVAVPLILLSVVLGGAGFSTLAYATLWRSKVGLQLRLDRCVEKVALDLVGIQNAIEASNLRMKVERAAAAAAAAPSLGGSIEAARPVLAAEVAFQESKRIQWLVRQARWIAERGCDRGSDLFFPLPSLKWTRPPEDTLGPRPLDWDGKNTRIEIRLWRTNRFSQARVARSDEKRDGDGSDENENDSSRFRLLDRWRAAWIRARPSLD